MKLLKIIFCMACVLVMCEGCKVLQPSTETNSSTVKQDSTSIEITERFVPVYLPGDTVYFTQQIDCPDVVQASPVRSTPTPFKQAIKGKRSSGSIEIDKVGRLRAIFNCDAWQDSVKVRDTEISRLKSTVQSDSTTKTVQVKFIPKVYKYSMWFTCGLLSLLALWCLWQLVKLYMKLKPF